jgi:hypothetical protein
MSPMDHAAAHERIEDLLLEPARLAAFARSTAPDDLALRDHLDGCPACRADLQGWARLQRALAEALPANGAEAAAGTAPIEPPASLRAKVIAASRPAQSRLPLAGRAAAGLAAILELPRRAWLATALVVVVMLVGAGVILDQAARISQAREEARGLAQAIAAVDRINGEPQHRVVQLRTADGAAGGSISWTRHDLVVLTTALQAPKPGEIYRCWLSDNGTGWAIGKMYFADGAAYWVGALDQWTSFEIGPTSMFRVSLEPPGADPAKRSGPIVLEAALGS